MSNAERQRKHRENKQCENTDRNEGVTERNEGVTERNEGVTERNESRNERVTKCNAPLKEKIKIKEEDKEKDLNAFCAEPSAEGFAPEPESPPVISLPLNDKTLFTVFQKNVDSWQALYPAVNVPQELRNMRGWLDANPTKRKTKGGINRFINSWLAKEQDKRGYFQSRASPAPDGLSLAQRNYQTGLAVLAQMEKEEMERAV